MSKTFAEIRGSVSNIHVYKTGGECAGVTILTPTEVDAREESIDYNEGDIEGDGSRENPFTFRGAATVSPHFDIIALWLKCRDRVDSVPFIRANCWVLQVVPDGVIAEDGHFTKFD